MNFDETEIVREALHVLKHGKTMPSYPFMLVGTPDGYEIVPPDELSNMSDEELRARWQHYDEPNRAGITEKIWQCRSRSRITEALQPIRVPFAYPYWDAVNFKHLVLLFWPPRRVGEPLEYITHYGTVERASEGLCWLVNNPDQPTFTGRRGKTEYDDQIMKMTADEIW